MQSSILGELAELLFTFMHSKYYKVCSGNQHNLGCVAEFVSPESIMPIESLMTNAPILIKYNIRLLNCDPTPGN